MTEFEPEITVTYANAAEGTRALKRIRRFGLESPRDHLIVEAARVGLIVLPVLLVAMGSVRFDQAVAAYYGYFAVRGFDLFLKPAIIRRFGPRFPFFQSRSPVTLTFGANGVRSESVTGALSLPWASLSPPGIFANGVILRVGPEQSIAVAAERLPDGMSLVDFGRQLAAWHAKALS